jgi:hypothetical protein
MNVSVKLVVFEHPNPAEWHRYCSYCPAIKTSFGRAETVKEVLRIVREDYLIWELGYRIISTNLPKRGWIINENSIIPPTFTDEEALELTKKSYELQQLVNAQIFVLNVEVPKAKTTW